MGSLAPGVAVLASLAVTVAVGAFANPALSDLPRASWQPRDAAFSVWALIYTGIAAGGVVRLAFAERAGVGSAVLLCVSLLSSAGWLVAVRRTVALSAALLVLAFVTALAALALAPVRDPCSLAERAVALGPALLTGWLALAAPLGINLAVEGAELPAWAALPSALAAAAVGGYCATPELGAVLVWAAAFSPRSPTSVALGALGVASAVAAVARSAMR